MMYGYGDDFKVSPRYANSTKAYVESVIEDYNERQVEKPQYQQRTSEDILMENFYQKSIGRGRFNSFVETVKTSLVVESLYNLYKECVDPKLLQEDGVTTIMRSITNDYVQEIGYTNILNKMKSASSVMSEMYNIITKNAKAIIEAADKDTPETFKVEPEMKDEFFKQLDYNNTDEISKAISDRVAMSMKDFVTANTKDHENIAQALDKAQEDIEASDPEDQELREFYEMKGKRAVTEIRNAPKSIFHGMVSAMCESVLKHQDTHREFLNEGHLDIGKIASRVSLMYTFLEMVNTTRIGNINEAYLEEIIRDLKQ